MILGTTIWIREDQGKMSTGISNRNQIMSKKQRGRQAAWESINHTK